MKIFTTAIILTAFMTPLAAQWVHHRTPGIPRTADGKPNLTAPAPRTADGKPELTGLWEVVADVAVSNVGDLKPADVQPWAQTLVQQRTENFGRDNPHYQCLPQGPAYTTTGGMKRLLQTPEMMVILNEDLTYRQIYMDGRALETDPNPSWMGYSVGHWDGDTLVVESNGFNDRTWLVGYHPHTKRCASRSASSAPISREVTFASVKTTRTLRSVLQVDAALGACGKTPVDHSLTVVVQKALMIPGTLLNRARQQAASGSVFPHA